LIAHQSVYHINFLQAVVIGLLQGVTELFPISSLGHTVLVPSWIGGSWATLVRQESSKESPYLAFVVGLHLATAVVLLGFYFREWVRLVRGFLTSLLRRRAVSDQERLSWFIVIATIPVGALGIIFEHQFRTLFAKPVAAAIFLMVNGLILAVGELFRRRRASGPTQKGVHVPEVSPTSQSDPSGSPLGRSWRNERIVPMDAEGEHALAGVGYLSAAVIGASQALALLSGISREGVAMVGGLFRGLDNENALRFSFLLSTPVIFAAGLLKIPDLLGSLGDGIRAQVVVGSLAAADSSLFAIIFLSRYFRTRTLIPFAAYSLAFGFVSVIRFGVF
jgi:undecaprenyl-diphosphatase